MAGHTGFVGLAEVQSFQAKSILANVSDGAFVCTSNRTRLPLYQLIQTGVFLHIQSNLFLSPRLCGLLQTKLNLSVLQSQNGGFVTKMKQCIWIILQCLVCMQTGHCNPYHTLACNLSTMWYKFSFSIWFELFVACLLLVVRNLSASGESCNTVQLTWAHLEA